MEHNSNKPKNSILSGFSWAFAERIILQGAGFIVSIILARLLDPAVYGTLALANIFIAIVNAVTLTGFSSALIQKKDASDTDFSSTLYFSLGVSAVGYGLLFLCAPLIAQFFSNADLTPIIRVESLILITAAADTVLRAHVLRRLDLRLLFLSAIWSSLLSAAVGIIMAYAGFGFWALVAQSLTASIADSVVLLFIGSWRPSLRFSFASIRQIYGFGWKLIAASVADAVYSQLRSLVIGKKYTETTLAYYQKGQQFPNLLVTNINAAVINALMPALSRRQDDLQVVKGTLRKFIRAGALLLFPLMIGLLVCARPIVLLLLTEKWLPCVPYMRLLCLALMLKPLLTASLQAILSVGRSDVYLKVQTAQKLVGVAVILVTVLCFSSPVAIAVGEIVSYFLFACISAVPNKKYLSYSLREQLADIAPALRLAAVMGVVIYPISLLKLPVLAALPLQVLSGAAIYLLLCWKLKLDSFLFLLEKARDILAKRRGQRTVE